ncbi:hypothetical protein [Ramlibacter sp.]|uniref:hypothetical protein n=1 Tax=Ramlibacter sp. TaxID=1917967 RepID=UPI00185DAFA4|nr:hypothetical protein [Ramlibacter sp.]MBA2672568.1 hypothetical protein [Ramlibacter sp.]
MDRFPVFLGQLDWISAAMRSLAAERVNAAHSGDGESLRRLACCIDALTIEADLLYGKLDRELRPR